MSREPEVGVLVEILRRYDLILIQEIVDKSGKAIIQLLNRLQRATGQKYRMTGERGGQGENKENDRENENKNKT